MTNNSSPPNAALVFSGVLMKFIIRVLQKGKYCFLFTPLMMLALLLSVKLGVINAASEVHPWVSAFLDWRYSELSFFFPLFIGGIVSLLVTIIVISQPVTFKEKNRLGRYFNLFAIFTSNLIMFWAGLFLAWSITSPFIAFVTPIKWQELMVFYMLISAVIFNYGILKFKHNLIKG